MKTAEHASEQRFIGTFNLGWYRSLFTYPAKGWVTFTPHALELRSRIVGKIFGVSYGDITRGEFISHALMLYRGDKIVATISSLHMKEIVGVLQKKGIKINKKGLEESVSLYRLSHIMEWSMVAAVGVAVVVSIIAASR